MVRLVNKSLDPARQPDGFDGDANYQMVPVRDTRDITLITDAAAAVLTFSKPGIAAMGNFRNAASNTPLPSSGPAVFVDTFQLPPNARTIVALKGVTPGITFLSGRDIAVSPDDIDIDVDLLVSVKPALERKFAFVYVSDLRRRSVRTVYPEELLLNPVRALYKRQANVTVTEVPGEGGVTREIDVLADLGDPVDIPKDDIQKRLDDRVNELFPTLFAQCDFIVYILWRIRGKRLQDHVVGTNRQTADHLNTVYLGLEPPDSGDRILVMAHEFGHAMGLPHARERCLMFPTTGGMATRLIAGHIEQLHTGPIFPDP